MRGPYIDMHELVAFSIAIQVFDTFAFEAQDLTRLGSRFNVNACFAVNGWYLHRCAKRSIDKA
ncbi:hypothetical protein D3C87_1782740 [compost metagenome]